VNVPLIDNVLGVRMAGTFEHQGGWVDQPAAGIKNFTVRTSRTHGSRHYASGDQLQDQYDGCDPSQ